jgi:hypothetical protein
MSKVLKWVLIAILLYVGLVLGLAALGLVLRILLFLVPLFVVALPIVVWDLLFRAPAKGQKDSDEAGQPDLGL